MSSQKGNISRSRPQKHQNTHSFKNDLHDTSHQTKKLNETQVNKVCIRCKHILEWKIKFKKYKVIKKAKKCTVCNEMTVQNSYHIMCIPCSEAKNVCPKCNLHVEVIDDEPKPFDKNDLRAKSLLGAMSERKRRTFLRKMQNLDTSEPGAIEELLLSMKITGNNEDDSSDSDDTE